MQRAAFGQEVVGRPPAVIVVAAVPARTRVKYGPLADDFVQREAGHATENLLLEAAARNLAAVSVGGVDSAAAATILALAPGTIVIYVIPIGYPMTATG
jgi:nitroreductase